MGTSRWITRLLSGIGPVSLAVLLFFSSAACASADDAALTELVSQAERILLATPEEDVDLAGGEEFLVEINRVLRGSGQKGKLARIVQSGDETTHPTFKAGQQYVFLLRDNVGAAGWIDLSDVELPVTDGKVQVKSGDEETSVALDDFRDLIAANPYSKVAAGPRESLAGGWILMVSQQGMDLRLWLLDVKKDQDEYTSRQVATSRFLSASTLKSSTVTDDAAEFVFESDGQTFQFQGRLNEGTVFGNVAIADRVVLPARMVATEMPRLKGEEATPSSGRKEFTDAQGADEPFPALQEFVTKFNDSPLALDAYRELLGAVKKQDLEQPMVEELIDAYLKTAQRWGDRIEVKAFVDTGVALSKSGVLPELAMKYLTTAEGKLTPETSSMWKLPLLTEKASLLIATGKEDEGIALLEPLHQEHPFDPEITYTLARHAEKSDKPDEALALYSEIAVLPMLQRMLMQQWSRSEGADDADRDPPAKAIARIWKEKHGNTDELEAYLDEVYEKKILGFPHEKVEARDADGGTRVVLCELFTGAQCPPCVGADVATAALEASYPHSDVIVLRYHQHIPGPDPLANEDSQQRFAYYQGEGTPTLAVDGKKFEGAGGFLQHAEGLYKRLCEEINESLREKLSLTIKLTAEAKAGVVTISAKAGGLPEFPANVRLRLVLAEDKLGFNAGNGIRMHEMVVRAMPGGVDGIEAKDGQLEFSDTVDLAVLKADLKKYLKKVESEVAAPFARKPLELKGLHLVALLQNDETKDVLQAASIAVTGDLTTPEDEKPAATDEEQPDNAKKPGKAKAGKGDDEKKSDGEDKDADAGDGEKAKKPDAAADESKKDDAKKDDAKKPASDDE